MSEYNSRMAAKMGLQQYDKALVGGRDDMGAISLVGSLGTAPHLGAVEMTSVWLCGEHAAADKPLLKSRVRR
jgi:hypothetical protein